MPVLYCAWHGGRVKTRVCGVVLYAIRSRIRYSRHSLCIIRSSVLESRFRALACAPDLFTSKDDNALRPFESLRPSSSYNNAAALVLLYPSFLARLITQLSVYRPPPPRSTPPY